MIQAKKRLLSQLIIIITLIFGQILLPAQADEKARKEKELKALQAKIGKLQKTIAVKEDSKSRYLSQLKTIEKKIGHVSRKIINSNQAIGTKQTELKGLRKSRKKHQKQLVSENEALANQVYSAFTLGKQERVKLLFSQQSASELQRNLVYYQYFSKARLSLIEDVEANISQIVETEDNIDLAKKGLEKTRKTLTQQKTQLGQDSKKRKNVIASLDKQLKTQGGDLNKLKDEATELQNLINDITDIFVNTPEPKRSKKAFAKLKGRLAWPVKGKVKKLFGRHKHLSELRWQGIMIQAPAGRHVRAISGGRVAFADWLRGLGNLIIIDHGNSYLSLYGHNESLYKSAGEWVEAGDIISSIGNSGGQQKPGLYFEIRKKGKPQNPTKWCKAGNQFAS